MAKELPYFKFEPAEYLTKDISFCSLSAQGLFINICSYYWQRNCSLTKEQLLKRLNYENEFNELLKEGVIDLIENNIIIKFLDNQLNSVEEKSKTNSSNGSKGGRPKKNQTESEIKPNEKPIESESKGIREDKIILDNITTTEIINFDDAVNICLFSEQWKEDIERLFKIDRTKIQYALQEFKLHCGTTGENKPKSLNQFKKHFTNWVRVKKQYQVKTENKDRL
jgi:hypothetical protein